MNRERRLRILHVARSPLMFIEFLLPTMRAQQRQGHYVAIASADEAPWAERMRDQGFDVFDNGTARSLGPINIVRGVLRTRKIIAQQRFDVVITHTPIGSAIGRAAAWLAGARKIMYFCHGLTCTPLQGAWQWFPRFALETILGSVTDAIIVMNNYDENLARTERLVRRGGGKVFRIASMGVDLTEFTPRADDGERRELLGELGAMDAEKLVISVARVMAEKGVYEYFDAARQVTKVLPRTLFMLAGDGPDLDHLRRLVDRHDMAARFKLLGWRSDVNRLVRASDLFVLPTYYQEGLPVSIIEAMASSKPVIASVQRGCVDAVVDGVTGFIVPIKDPDALAHRIIQVLDDDGLCLRMGQAGRRRVEQEYETQRCTRQILDALDEALVDLTAPASVPVRTAESVPAWKPRINWIEGAFSLRPDGNGCHAAPANAISVDVEDWLQSTVDSNLPLTDRFINSTRKVLAAFDRRGVKGTFFILGLAAKKAPDLVRDIQQGGHEIQSHGYGHEMVYTLSRQQYRSDLERSKKLLEDMTGRPITGYRAPAFEITLRNLWALDIIVETGYQYDSSVFPLQTSRYGIDGAPWFPHRLRTPSGYDLLELPVASFLFCGMRLPVAGGGYFRLFPYPVIRLGVSQLNRMRCGATIYLHPYEYDPIEFEELGYPIPWALRIHQGLGRSRFAGRVERLLCDYRFGTIQETIAQLGEVPRYEYRVPDGR